MIKVVIFDFDDTLCLTEEACFHLENLVVQQMGHLPMTRETHQKNWGVLLRMAIAGRMPCIDVDEFMKRHQKIFADYSHKRNMDSIPKKNLTILDKLKKAKKRLAILTTRSSFEVKHLMHNNHPLQKRIEIFYNRNNLEYLKPDARTFNQAFYHFHVKPEECVYVGDGLTDAMAAKGAKMHFIAVLESGLRKKEDFRDFKVDFFAEKFTKILPYILQH